MRAAPEVVITPDLEGLSRQAAQRFGETAREAIRQRGAFYVALSGGATPRRLYQLLASPPYRDLDWSRIEVFWSDERCLPPDHPESSYRLARDTLLSSVPVPSERVHRLRGEREPKEAATEYERLLRAALPPGADGVPQFDLILLGMGTDGHTASLFPGSPLLSNEDGALVAAVVVPRLGAPRLTFTPRLLNAARHIFFLVSGADKAPALAAVLEGKRDGQRYPARMVAPARGRVVWFVDAGAAQRLRQPRAVSV